MKKSIWTAGLLAVVLSACSPSPQAIEYGADECGFCRMTIVDQQHSAQLVTQKGRVYKFDAIECMVHYLEQNGGQEASAHLLVADYERPGKLIDAASAHYLISPGIPSPMGAYLSAFSKAETADRLLAEKGGKRYTWAELLQNLNQHSMH